MHVFSAQVSLNLQTPQQNDDDDDVYVPSVGSFCVSGCVFQ